MRILRAARDAIREHAVEGYPEEVCGVLVGPREGELVLGVRRARNLTEGPDWTARHRYELDPRDHLRIRAEAAAAGLEIVGYYHSHPDWEPVPSESDAEQAWAGHRYLIVSVVQGQASGERLFVAAADGGPLRSEWLLVE